MSYSNSILAQISAANQFVQLDVGELSAIGVDVRGTFVGTLSFEVSLNGVDWSALSMIPSNASQNTATVTSTTGVGMWIGSMSGLSRFRVRFSAYTSGMAQITIRADEDPHVVFNVPVGTTAGQSIAGGGAAEDAAAGTNPVLVGGVVRTATSPTTLVAGDAARATMTSGAALVVYPFAIPEVSWQYTGVLTTTTAAAARAAGAAGIRNYVSSLQFQNTSATATTVLVLDGATTIAQFNAPANMAAPAVVTFSSPIRGTAATALNVNCGTTAANVLINVQGFQAA